MKQTIYDSTYWYDEDKVKDDIIEGIYCDFTQSCENTFDNEITYDYQFTEYKKERIDNIDDSEIQNRMDDLLDWDYYDIKHNLERVDTGNYNVIGIGSVGQWNGRSTGYHYVCDMSEFFDGLRSDYNIEIYYDTEDKQLHADFHHHDGTNSFIYRLFDGDRDNFDERCRVDGRIDYDKCKRITRSIRPYIKGVLI